METISPSPPRILLIITVAYSFLLGGAEGLLSKVVILSILVLVTVLLLFKEMTFRKDTLIILMFAFLAIASPVYAEGSKWGSVLYSTSLLSGALFYLILRNTVGWKESLLYAAVFCGVINGIFGVFQALHRTPTGLFYNKNNYSHFLHPLVPLAIYLFVRSPRFIYALVPFFLIFSNLLSNSRGGMITMGVVILVIFLFLWKEKKYRLIKELALISGSAVAAYLMFVYCKNLLLPSTGSFTALQSPSEGLATDFVKHTLYRAYIYRDTFVLFLKAPAFGHGINSFGGLIQTVSNPYSYGLSIHGHNIFYNILIELGIVGLFFFLLFLWTVLRGNFFTSPAFYFKMGLISFLAHNIVEYNFPAPPFQVLFYILAALALEEGGHSRVIVTLRGLTKRVLMFCLLVYFAIVFYSPVVGHVYFERAKKAVNERHAQDALKAFLASTYFGYSVEVFHEAVASFLHQMYLSSGSTNGQLEELAEQNYLKALKLDSLNGSLYMEVARFYYETGKVALAEKYFVDAVNSFPYNLAYKVEAAQFYRRTGNAERAISILLGVNEFLKGYSAYDPLRAIVLSELAENYKDKGDSDLHNRYIREVEGLKNLDPRAPHP